MKQLLAILLSGFILSSFIVLKPAEVTDYLSIPGPIEFDGTAFSLAWSSNPNANYYKQEYIPKGETVEKYNQMILIEVIYGNLTIKEAVNAQIKVIEDRKKTDGVANYEVIENPTTGEYILDFIMSAGNKKTISLVEWNAYRYKAFEDKTGKKGVMLFAISKRGYNNKINDFFSRLKAKRMDDINALGAFTLPEIALKN